MDNGHSNIVVLRLDKKIWESSSHQDDSFQNAQNDKIMKKKRRITEKGKRETLLCSTCNLLIPNYSSCSNCNRFKKSNDTGLRHSELKPKLRPFDNLSKYLSKSSFDEYLQTKKFFKHLNDHFVHLPVEILHTAILKTGTIDKKMSAVLSMTYLDLFKHLKSLRIDHIQRWVRPTLQKMMQHPKNFNIFNTPVDVDALGLHDYNTKIKVPMDLGTIRSWLQRGFYDSVAAAIHDIELVFQNATSYNPPNHPIHQLAQELSLDFKNELKGIEEKCVREVQIFVIEIFISPH
jgi:hypothetical protein